MAMLSTAVERGADLATLEKLMDLQERFEKSHARKAFEEAMAAARAEIPTIRKNRRAGARRTDYRYEDLGEIAKTISPMLARRGLSYRFRTSSAPNEPVSVTCIVSHALGHYEENTLQGPRDDSGAKNSIQAIGSTVTYLQRYALKAALGLAAAHDDDGAAAGAGGDFTEDAPLTDAQREQLTSLLDEAGADSRKFCAYFEIETLGKLHQSRLKEAVAALEAKRKKKAAKAS